MSEKFEESSFEGRIKDRKTVEPQAPRSISIEQADNRVGRNNIPYNEGGEGHMGRDGSVVRKPVD